MPRDSRIKNARLALAVLFTAVFSLFFLFEPFRLYLGEPGQVSRDSLFYLGAVAILLAAFLIYYIIFRGGLAGSNATWFSLAVAIQLSLLFVWPIVSSDLFSYIYQGRVWSFGGLDPYLQTYDHLAGDPFYLSLVNSWSNRTSPYGPLFMIIDGSLTGLLSRTLLGSMIALKILFISANIGLAAVIFKFRSSREALYLYVLNPLVIFEIAINGHNDALFILFLVAAFFVSRSQCRHADIWSGALLALSVAIKYFSLILVPIWFLAAWRRALSRQERLRLAISTVLAAAVIILTCLPFWSALSGLVSSVFNQASLSGTFASPLIVIIRAALGLIVPEAAIWSVWIGRAVFLLFYFALLSRVWKYPARENELFVSFLAITAFLLTSLSWMMPWYLLAPLALGALLYSLERYRTVAVWSIYSLTFYGIIYYLTLR